MTRDKNVVEALKKIADSKIAEHSARFFKSGPGEYGEGDQFLGIRVPKQREIAKKYKDLPLIEVAKLLQSPFHEVRLTAVLILVYKYQKNKNFEDREDIYHFYLDNLKGVNNWDLVDSSAKYIAGHFLFEYNEDRSILYQLSDSDDLWERRIAIMTTFYFVDQGDFDLTLELAEKYLDAPEDLIHKATGWMLREIGKQDEVLLRNFLDNHYQNMPRTMLRYAMEKLDEPVRQLYLQGKV
ncbi:DNA alkylation repair protein [Rhodohalobacter sp. 614A]|uniref:DNA alkylation repair protein n=1 Tax=Rhodohalobacter sp. 614A TaxID=2908649 RepID=UPI001F29A328|nr:DNA alkylation repair protein [Rhodohalobacter sp. 614A]